MKHKEELNCKHFWFQNLQSAIYLHKPLTLIYFLK